jgi:gluconate:H+ symporter, GntP family
MPSEIQLILAAVFSVVSLILLVTRLRVHPFLALLVASLILGFLAGLVPTDIIKNFGKGFGDVMGSVGIIIGLGTMLGGVLVLSGGADRLATSLTSIGGKNWIPWTTFFVALLIGLPLFFEVGFVLLVPIALAISKRSEMPILRVGLPMLAGLSIAHGLVPPHPAPTLAVQTFHADPGKTILLAILGVCRPGFSLDLSFRTWPRLGFSPSAPRWISRQPKLLLQSRRSAEPGKILPGLDPFWLQSFCLHC